MFIRIYYLIIYVIEGIIFSQYCASVFEAPKSKLLKNISVAALYSILFLISFLQSPQLNLFSFFAANFIFVFLIYRPVWYTALFHSALSTAVMCLCELIIIAIVPYEAAFSYEGWTEFRIWIIPVICDKIIYFFIMYLLGHFSGIRHGKTAQGDRSVILFTAIPTISMFVMLTFLYLCADTALSPKVELMVLISTLLLLALNIIIWEVYSHNLEKNEKMMDLQLSLQKECDTAKYYKMLIQQSEDQSQFVHDIKKHLQSIALLNEKGDTGRISAYIESLIHSSALQSSSQICNNEFLNAILARYAAQCRKLNIAFRTDVRNGVCIFLKENDMTSLFCNLMDNAVEATAQIPGSFIELSVSERKGTAFTIITLTNSCRKNPFAKNKSGISTTKPDKRYHGYGMKIIERIVRNYNGEIQNYYTEDSHTFHTIITLKNFQNNI